MDKTFYLSPSGEIIYVESHEKSALEICRRYWGLSPVYPDDYLLEHGFLKYSFCGGFIGSINTAKKYTDILLSLGFSERSLWWLED